jgi:ribA/ribD-fused uncharacterized protein
VVDIIPEFRDEYYFLSNYYMGLHFTWRGVVFASGEHAFAYAKTLFAYDTDHRARVQQEIKFSASPGEAKKMGRQARIDVVAWDKHKDQYMREIVHAKFAGVPGLAGKLINTGCAMLVEGNNWNDTYWGRAKNKDGRWVGLNKLGVILMEERGYWLHSEFKENT